MGTSALFANCISAGCSSLQPPHQEAQTFSNQTLPVISFGENIFCGSCSCGSEKSGVGLPIRGDGTSRGLSFSPRPKNPTRTTKTASGSRNRFIGPPAQPVAVSPAQPPLRAATQDGSGDH